ncbi:MAG: RICIN domain-containing protein [Tateyamaria sp.]|uniref:RICIN domain-containing protein n=1 Tax=Tateyamaria sp. TaxID=1929288 RepID=UPI00329DF8A1
MRFLSFLFTVALIAMAPTVQAQNLNGWFKLQTQFQAPAGKCFEGNRYDHNSRQGGGAFMDDCQNVSGQLWKFEPAGGGYYRMKTMFQESAGKCFEGNSRTSGATLAGAAFMDDCQNVSGQLWRIIPAQDGYVRLTTQFIEGQNMCLEGNRRSAGGPLKGAAFMDRCQNVSGQLWLLIQN